MKAWSVAVGLLGVAGALVGAGFAGMRAQASAENATNALVLAERAAPAAPKVAASAHVVASTTPTVVSATPVASAAPVASATPAAVTGPTVTFRQTSTYNGAPVYVPDGCHGAYDVVMHFHGAHPYVRDLVEKANLDAVVAVFNAGNGAEKYSQAFQAGGTLTSLLRQIEMATAPLCAGAEAKPRRVALMAWSAGYAAVEKILGHDEDRERVDTALLADGLHAGFTDTFKRTLAPNALQSFRDFGELAKQGKSYSRSRTRASSPMVTAAPPSARTSCSTR